MKITKVSVITGELHTMDLPITHDQLLLWHSGEFIQNVFPDLTPSQREFLMTGITEEEWQKYMTDDEEESI